MIRIVAVIIFMVQAFSSLSAQHILRDTVTIFSYGVYCEEMVVEEYIVPDHIFKIHGKKIFLKDSLLAQCTKRVYELSYSYDSFDTYSFKDFKLKLGNQSYIFDFDTPINSIDPKEFTENVSSSTLWCERTGETIPLDTIEIIGSENKKPYAFSLKNINQTQLDEVSNLLTQHKNISVNIPSLKYPLKQMGCGRATFYFPSVRFRKK